WAPGSATTASTTTWPKSSSWAVIVPARCSISSCPTWLRSDVRRVTRSNASQLLEAARAMFTAVGPQQLLDRLCAHARALSGGVALASFAPAPGAAVLQAAAGAVAGAGASSALYALQRRVSARRGPVVLDPTVAGDEPLRRNLLAVCGGGDGPIA